MQNVQGLCQIHLTALADLLVGTNNDDKHIHSHLSALTPLNLRNNCEFVKESDRLHMYRMLNTAQTDEADLMVYSAKN